MKLKILMVVGGFASKEEPSFQPFVKGQIESIKALGHTVEIFNIKGNEFAGNYILKTISLRKFAAKFKPDIIHSHYSYVAFSALSTLPFPQVISFMGDDINGDFDINGNLTIRSYLHRPFAVIPAMFAKAVIVKSKGMMNNISHKKVYVIPNGVNFSTFYGYSKADARKELNLPQGKKYIIFPGDVNDTNKKFHLTKAASDILKNKFEIDHEILHMRTASQIELNKYFNAVDALVFTSKSEGSPNVIKEAMASNTPIVTVDVGDVKEVISNAKNCYIVKDTPEEIAEKLFAVLQDGKRTNGRKLINHLELSNIAKRVESVYRDVLVDVRNKN